MGSEISKEKKGIAIACLGAAFLGYLIYKQATKIKVVSDIDISGTTSSTNLV